MEILNLKELFGECIFKIPNSQRGYTWGEKQWNELWDTLINIRTENGESATYCLGVILIQKLADNKINDVEKWVKSYMCYNETDGHQRVTTTLIILNELLNTDNNRYNKQSISISNFLYQPEFDETYSKNITQAKSYFYDKIKQLSQDEKIDFYEIMTTSLVFKIEEMDNQLNVKDEFEIINRKQTAAEDKRACL